jgi:AcrR family transcriptional regulator
VTDSADARRIAILDAATAVFLRYGFKKTSMDDLARAAGLSRQGLYLHFPTKEELFKAGILRLIAATRAAGQAALASELPVDERVLAYFVAIHSPLGESSTENMSELMEATVHLVGDAAAAFEEERTAALARLLKQSGIAAAWKEAGLSAAELAAQLFATSHGIKLAVKSRDDYRKRMRVAVQIVCNGRAR